MTLTIDSFIGEYGFLSNFHQSNIIIPEIGAGAKTAEHGFQAFKAQTSRDRALILRSSTPQIAKQRGREVSCHSDWNFGRRVWAMQCVINAKFEEGTGLARKLIDTGNSMLIEGNSWHDDYWGDCRCPRHKNMPAKNMLGEILMARRIYLKEVE